MSLNRNSSNIPFVKSQQGSMLVMAVFIIVIFGLLASALSSILSSSQDAVSYEVLGVSSGYCECWHGSRVISCIT